MLDEHDAAVFNDATPDDIEARRALWCAVLEQAIKDATGYYSATPLERQQARDWFQSNGKDFREVCHLAGYDPEWIRKRVLDRMEQAGAGTAPRTNATATLDASAETAGGRSKLSPEAKGPADPHRATSNENSNSDISEFKAAE